MKNLRVAGDKFMNNARGMGCPLPGALVIDVIDSIPGDGIGVDVTDVATSERLGRPMCLTMSLSGDC